MKAYIGDRNPVKNSSKTGYASQLQTYSISLFICSFSYSDKTAKLAYTLHVYVYTIYLMYIEAY